ncbi:putative Fe-S cluster assembly protein SufT [Coraliomargarita parva]|uniref:putative Fe-S cluster assembly protein SufT n=1 Tax=Coraliomargarita parva TaxID=3014050 RepID=UPI0022B3C77A|nr:putative Fe-S cluster assembly protein SufT [Coraliomargarita parva]
MSEDRILTREVEATLIPQGTPMPLPEGEPVTITHRLGGNYTVMTSNGMYRIKGVDGDALGEEITDEIKKTDAAHSGPPDRDALWESIKKVFDPEIPVNIVDLGLVYSLEVNEQLDGGYKIDMQMTLTAPGCGMGPAIAEDAKYQLEGVPGVSEAQVDIVWDPPWNQDMITEEGKMVLGLI